MLKGIDLSNWQSTVPSGYDFYILKASEGNGYEDPRLGEHLATVLAMKKPYGFYHYARPDLGNTPEMEASWFLSLVNAYKGKAIYALDWEGEALNYPAEWALRWLNFVYEKTGVRPLFYCSSGYLNTGKYKSIAENDFGLWLAQYAPKPTLSTESGWNVFALWQFTDDLNGYDGNYFYGDKTTWEEYATGKPVTHTHNDPEQQRPVVPEADSGGVYRVYNPNNGEHYYTLERKMAQHLVDIGWTYEGIVFYTTRNGATGKPVTVLYSKSNEDHIYTMDQHEIKTAEKNQWKNQGTAFLSYGNVPVYCLYNPYSKTGQHFYTADPKEVMNCILAKWDFEGVRFFALKKGVY